MNCTDNSCELCREGLPLLHAINSQGIIDMMISANNKGIQREREVANVIHEYALEELTNAVKIFQLLLDDNKNEEVNF